MDTHDGWTRRQVLGALAATGALAAWPSLALGASRDVKRTIGKRAIPRTGEEIPMIGLGTWRTFDVGDSREERAPLVEVLRRFFARGGRLVDSSPMYGEAEEVVGDLLERIGRRDEAFVATKVWTRGEQAGIRQMRESMRKLHAPQIDLMQVHNLVDWRTQLDTLRDWKKRGRVRYVGVTHWRESAFDELERIIENEHLDFVQLPYSVASRKAEERLLPAAREHRTAVLVLSPFERGELFRRVRGREVPEWASEFGAESWAQIFLKWILGHPAVTCPLPATSDPEHLVDNMGAGVGPMPDQAMRDRIVRELDL
ncbi:MAG: aldo/keto reductase [Myxococcota bacterium]